MKSLYTATTASLLLILFFITWFSTNGTATLNPDSVPVPSPRKHLKAFSSEADLKSFLKKIRKKRGGSGNSNGTGYGAGAATETVNVSAAPMMKIDGASSADKESITNTQHAGVDEGGIVKMYGDYFVVLRRGRLFTIAIGDNSLKSVSSINAYGPDIDPSGTWYDEMLISDNNI